MNPDVRVRKLAVLIALMVPAAESGAAETTNALLELAELKTRVENGQNQRDGRSAIRAEAQRAGLL